MHGPLGRPASAPLKVTVDNVVTTDLQENLRGIERQIEQVRQAAAPLVVVRRFVGGGALAVTWLVPARHYR